MPVISGQVLGVADRPVRGAIVYIVHAPVNVPDLAMRTDAQGRFGLSVPVAGSYCVGVRFEGRSLQQDVTVGVGEASLLLRLPVP